MEHTRRDRRSELPPACTLGADDGPARLRRWQHLDETAAVDPIAAMFGLRTASA